MPDVVWVLVEAGDGPVFIPHSPEQYARLMDGVDVEASWAAVAPLDAADPDATIDPT